MTIKFLKKIPRDEVLALLARLRLACGGLEAMADLLANYPAEEGATQLQALEFGVRHAYRGVGNGFLAELYRAITGERVEVVGPVADLLPCPCCEQRTLEAHNVDSGSANAVCDYCGWIDDGTTELETRSNVNQTSIADRKREIMANPNYYEQKKWSSERNLTLSLVPEEERRFGT